MEKLAGVVGVLDDKQYLSSPLWPEDVSQQDRIALRKLWPRIDQIKIGISACQHLSFYLLSYSGPGLSLALGYFGLAGVDNPVRVALWRCRFVIVAAFLLGALLWLTSRLLVKAALRLFPEAKRLHKILHQLHWRLIAAALFPKDSMEKRVDLEGAVLDNAVDPDYGHYGYLLARVRERLSEDERSPAFGSGPWDGDEAWRETYQKAFATYPLSGLYYEYVHTSFGWGSFWGLLLLELLPYFIAIGMRADIGPVMPLIHLLFWSHIAIYVVCAVRQSRVKYDQFELYL